MKTKNVIFIILLVLLAAGAGWWFAKNPQTTMDHADHKDHKDIYYCPMHPQVTSDKPGTCPICQMKLVKKEGNSSAELKQQVTESKKEKKILYYRNPMDPSIKSPTPMKDSMGMDYVPVYEESKINQPNSESVSGYSSLSIDTQKQQLIGIKTAPVMKKTLTKTIHAYGYVAHDLELYEAQLEYLDAWRTYYAFQARRPIKDEFRADWREYYKNEPSQGRWRSDDKLKAQERLIKAEYELRHMGLTDPQLAQLREIKYGQPWVQPDLIFFDKDQPFWIYAQVLENDLGFIAPGQKVMATIAVYKETVEGVVKSVATVVDPETRTSRVRIELPHYKGELSVNMYVNVDMPVELDDSLVVPRDAIMDTGLSQIVFVQTKEGIFEPRKITTGFEGDGMVAVKSGLKEGETIVTSGNFLLDSESRLQGSLAAGGQ